MCPHVSRTPDIAAPKQGQQLPASSLVSVPSTPLVHPVLHRISNPLHPPDARQVAPARMRVEHLQGCGLQRQARRVLLNMPPVRYVNRA